MGLMDMAQIGKGEHKDITFARLIPWKEKSFLSTKGQENPRRKDRF